MIGSIKSGPPLGIPVSQPVRTASPPAEVSARHVPAQLDIVNRSAEISADWRAVWDERGLKRPSSELRERKQRLQADFLRELGINVRQGDEAGDLRRPNKPNIFGRQAYEDYMIKSKVDVAIDVTKARVQFDVRVHPPEISVKTRPIAGK